MLRQFVDAAGSGVCRRRVGVDGCGQFLVGHGGPLFSQPVGDRDELGTLGDQLVLHTCCLGGYFGELLQRQRRDLAVGFAVGAGLRRGPPGPRQEFGARSAGVDRDIIGKGWQRPQFVEPGA